MTDDEIFPEHKEHLQGITVYYYHFILNIVKPNPLLH